MKTFNRICVTSYTITDSEGTSFTLERGREYTTSAERHGHVKVFSRYWVEAPVDIFAGAVPGPGTPHDQV